MGKAIAPVSFPDSDSGYGWDFDIEGITDFVEKMGIKLPVVFRWSTTKYRYGTHYAHANEHKIVIARNQPMESAADTILHELRHAKQAEEWAEKNGKCQTAFYRESYKKNDGEWGKTYENNRYEIDARRFAQENAHLSIVVEV